MKKQTHLSIGTNQSKEWQWFPLTVNVSSERAVKKKVLEHLGLQDLKGRWSSNDECLEFSADGVKVFVMWEFSKEELSEMGLNDE